jgi:glycine dehydrogenase subunit 1
VPFVPHTPEEVAAMLRAIGAPATAALFDELPPLPEPVLDPIPPGAPEWEVGALARTRAAGAPTAIPFLGAGAYDHHVPAAVWQLLSRGEFYSGYTPYQAEASQGTLQVLYEFQSMLAGVTGLPVAGASVYDGATALAEAALMALRAAPQVPRRVLVPRSVHPRYRAALAGIVALQGVEIAELPFDVETGTTDPGAIATAGPAGAVVIPQPNYFGALEPVHALTDAAHGAGALAVALVNPLALAALRPPGRWGARGADIACGEGQPLGMPLAGGGPYLGFLACRAELVRQMPGRLAGRTVDRDGRRGFVLTLQAREQHIRRARATSNVCTNQGLLAAAATIHLALLGPQGLAGVARASAAALRALLAELTALPGVRRACSAPVFHEASVRLPGPAQPLLDALAVRGILGGVALGPDYPELGEDALLVCATEKRSAADIGAYRAALGALLGS